MSLSVIILAGGIGKRMKSKKVKALHLIMGKPMVEWVIETARAISPDSILLVYGNKGEEMKNLFQGVNYVFQPEPLGTGDAVSRGLGEIKEEKGHTLILSSDVPLLSSRTIENLIDYHKKNNYDATLLTFIPDNPSGYGRIIREGTEIKAIVEEKDASEEEKRTREVNGGTYIFSLQTLRDAIGLLRPDNTQGEYYLTDVISIIRNKGGKIGGLKIDDPSELKGVNTREDQNGVIELLRRRKIRELQMEGVTIFMPDTVYIEPDVKIGSNTIIHPNVVITGNTVIGSDCIIYPFVHLSGDKIPPGSKIEK